MRTSTYLGTLVGVATTVFSQPGAGANGADAQGADNPELDYDRPDAEQYNRHGTRYGRFSGGPSQRNRGYGGNSQQPPKNDSNEDCMSRADALNVAGTFQSLIQGYTEEQALAALTPDFMDHSSAVSIIINRGGSGPEDITEPIFTSRDEFMKGHEMVWSTCEETVTMVWETIRSGQGQENENSAVPVIGVAVLETEPTSQSTGEELERARAGGYNYRIHTLWSEFNTAAWLVNNGAIKVGPEVEVIPPPAEEVAESPESTTVRKRGLPNSKFDVGLA